MPDEPIDFGVTLGEVARNITRLETTVARIDRSIQDLRHDMLSELELRITDRLAVVNERVQRLERVVYGMIGILAVALVGEVFSILNGGK